MCPTAHLQKRVNPATGFPFPFIPIPLRVFRGALNSFCIPDHIQRPVILVIGYYQRIKYHRSINTRNLARYQG